MTRNLDNHYQFNMTDQYLYHTDLKMRIGIAMFGSLNIDQYKVLTHDPEPGVRLGLLERKDLPREIFEILYQDPSPYVILSLAKHPLCTPEDLFNLALRRKDIVERHMNLFLFQGGLTTTNIIQVIEHLDYNKQIEALHHPNLKLECLYHLKQHRLQHIAENALIEYNNKLVYGLDSIFEGNCNASKRIALQAATKTNRRAISLALQDSSQHIRALAIRNGYATLWQRLVAMFRDKHPDVRYAAFEALFLTTYVNF